MAYASTHLDTAVCAPPTIAACNLCRLITAAATENSCSAAPYAGNIPGLVYWFEKTQKLQNFRFLKVFIRCPFTIAYKSNLISYFGRDFPVPTSCHSHNKKM